jgi:hypothetical protein
MKPNPDPIVARELPIIKKIVEDEVWYEGERRGCTVSPNDPIVHENVCRVILQIGASLREMLTQRLAQEQTVGVEQSKDRK